MLKKGKSPKTKILIFIPPGDAGTFLRSTGASTAPDWATADVTIGSTTTPLGGTSNALAGMVSITMGNGSYGNASVASVSGTGPWTATITGISSTAGILVGQNITATAGTGSLFGGSPTSVVVASIASGTSITVTVTGGTIPTVGTITAITIFGFLQVPTGTTAQRPYVPANGMIRYNTTQSTFEGYSSAAWSSLGGVKSVDGYTYIQAETSAGASNGDLDFYAEASNGSSTTQVGQWNRTNLKDYTGTLVGTQTTQNVFNATATTINFGQGATSLSMGSSTGTSYINNATISLPNATSITAGQTTVALLNTTATTVNAFGAATTLSIGAATGTATINNANVVITGNLTVNGTTTTVNSTTLTVDDKNIELGSVGTPSDITADGGGITLKGATDKTLNWVSSTTSWTSSEDFNLVTGKVYEINGTSVLSATTLGSAVVTSSLTTVGTIGTGTWQGTAVAGQYGGTGVNNSGKTITLGGNLTTSGAHATTLTTTGTTGVTLPTTGTLATLAGTESFTNKTLTSPTITTMTYAGVTLSNSVTGTGSMVLSAGPTFTGTLTGSVGSFSSTMATGALTVTGAITATGNITSNFSDDRLKTRTGTIQNALEKVLSLDGFHYHANETAVALGYDASQQQVGLSAQQVQAVLPEVIAPAPIDPQYMTLHYERIVPLLVEAIKEQQKQIEELKSKLGN
jgi:hypothetical protein